MSRSRIARRGPDQMTPGSTLGREVCTGSTLDHLRRDVHHIGLRGARKRPRRRRSDPAPLTLRCCATATRAPTRSARAVKRLASHAARQLVLWRNAATCHGASGDGAGRAGSPGATAYFCRAGRPPRARLSAPIPPSTLPRVPRVTPHGREAIALPPATRHIRKRVKAFARVFALAPDCHTAGRYMRVWQRHFYDGLQATRPSVLLPVAGASGRARRPAALPEASCETAEHALGFVGAPTGNRVLRLAGLRLFGCRTEVRGEGWSRANAAPPRPRPLRPPPRRVDRRARGRLGERILVR